MDNAFLKIIGLVCFGLVGDCLNFTIERDALVDALDLPVTKLLILSARFWLELTLDGTFEMVFCFTT